ncbi:hypothetical protein [Curtobacterium sp. MCBA15_001]|uniref:hypothetical protein n=1 Tax=Curtobacterium sp. MCBA15_001 TaxID=1898731 RepID=UPI0008DCBC85|nr:hypothetical protein [Curtobacterium sp. MCBA15_001]OIH96257.1 hypothetical protein BIU90_00445 [Curtobacterium sp. MCBA15_001]
MHAVRRSVSAALCLAAAAILVGCSAAGESEPDDGLETATSTDVTPSGSAPIVFAFVCATGDSTRTETYTTYSAVWEDASTGCRAKRITGTEMSEQQGAAVAATEGTATLEELATVCTRTEGTPWTTGIADEQAALLADGLALYCPGHPAMDHLRDALAAWRG